MFPIKAGGRQYNTLQSLRRERCWFPQRLYYRTSAQSSWHLVPLPSSVICHFTPSLEPTCLSKTPLPGCCFSSEIWASLLLHDNTLNPVQLLSSQSSCHLVGGLSQLGSMLGENKHISPLDSPAFGRTPKMAQHVEHPLIPCRWTSRSRPLQGCITPPADTSNWLFLWRIWTR